MEILGLFSIPWWLLLLLCPLCIVITFVLYCKYKQSYFRRRGIPGPKPSLPFGNIKDIGQLGLNVFDRKCADMYGPYFGMFYCNHPVLVICDTEMIREIMISQFSKFYDRADTIEQPVKWRDSLNNAKGIKWKYLRSVIQPTFSSSKIKNMRPILRRCLDDFITCLDSKLDEGGADHVIDMYKMYTALTMDVICSTAFGIEVNSQKNADDLFVQNASKVLGVGLTSTIVMSNFFFPEKFIRRTIMYIAGDLVDKNAMTFLTNTVRQAIKVRQEDTTSDYNDLLRQMMDTQSHALLHGVSDDKTFEQMKKDGLSDEDIIINGIILLAAGYETTSSLLSMATYCLAAYPEYQERLIAEIDNAIGQRQDSISYDKILNMEYLDMFLQETLRMYPPAGRFNRQPNVDVEIKGLKLLKGEDITFSTHAMHRNPLYWPEPDKFDPERFAPENKDNIVPYSFIPFGAGPRNCVGMKLALVEVKMAIVRLLQYARVARCPGFEIPPEISVKGGILRPKDGLDVRIEKR